MQWLNGYKTYLGLLALVVTTLAENLHLVPPAWVPYVQGAAALLTALGLAHKVEKAKGAARESPGV